MLLVTLALGPWGRPVQERAEHRAPGPFVLGLLGGAAMALMDFTPFTWPGIAFLVAAVAGLAVLLVRWSSASEWGWARIAALAWGALVVHTAVGFASPLPESVSVTAKVIHSSVLLLLVLGIGVVLWRRVWRSDDRRLIG